ncbi:hypothetical protein [Dongia sp.]|uniref:hypothetical protein n=1 Tax=Dongia sp. TaxID=1977262 RepID=UPI0035B45476
MAATESVRRAVLGRDVLTFASIRNAGLILKQQRLENEGASESDQLETAKARISLLEQQVSDLHESLEYFDTEHKQAEIRAETAEEQVRASAYRVQQLLDRIRNENGYSDADVELPISWESLISWCDVQLAGRVTLSPLARRSIKSAEFEEVEVAAKCLLWLANECRSRRIEGGEGTLRDEVVMDGIRNAHCGADQFDLDWQGQRHTADWHIKNGGNTRDPKRCLRIYYFWDMLTQQIVIAQMPAHRRTGAT